MNLKFVKAQFIFNVVVAIIIISQGFFIIQTRETLRQTRVILSHTLSLFEKLK